MRGFAGSERAVVTESVEQLEQAACEAVVGFSGIPGAKRRILARRVRYMAMDAIHAGERDPQVIHDRILAKLQADPVTSVILTTILLAVLSAFIQWVVLYFLNRRQPEHDDA